MRQPAIIILGGGLSGLLTAYWLREEGITARILEARSRLGGRIHTLRPDGQAPIEMGATWLGGKHYHLTGLLEELGIGISEQYMGAKAFYEPMSVSTPQLVDLPRNEEPSYRVEGGTDRLIQSLAERLDEGQVLMQQVVASVREKGSGLAVETRSDHFEADLVISTLPPRLLAGSIDFAPSLPGELLDVASRTHTWMAEAIKVALSYREPFWRSPDSSGTIFSNVGPVDEMYDHSSENRYALKGFMNPAYHAVSRDEREKLILKQLHRIYGDMAGQYIAYHEKVWQAESFTYASYDQHIVPHQHNGHPLFKKPFLDGRLLLSGSETASEFPGYMDGAVESARRSVGQAVKLLS